MCHQKGDGIPINVLIKSVPLFNVHCSWRRGRVLTARRDSCAVYLIPGGPWHPPGHVQPCRIRQRRHCSPVAHDTCFTVCIGEVGVSPAAPKTLDAGSGRDECVAFAPTTHPDPLGIRNGRSEVPSLGGEDSRLSIINVLLSYLRNDLRIADVESNPKPGLRIATPSVNHVARPRADPSMARSRLEPLAISLSVVKT